MPKIAATTDKPHHPQARAGGIGMSAGSDSVAGVLDVTPIDRLRKIMRRFHARENDDRGQWLGLGEISRAHGGDKDEVRGLLIELVAIGEVEALACTSGTFWCASRPPRAAPPPPGPMVFVLQRGGRGSWFDAEAFDTPEKALASLKYHRWAEQSRINGMGRTSYTGERMQEMRVVHLVSETPALAKARSPQ